MVEDVCELSVGEEVALQLGVGLEGVGDDYFGEGGLGGGGGTLQMGQWLFLLMARIL